MPETTDKSYTPELLSRQGEMTAWALTAAAGFGLYLLAQRTGLPYWAWFLSGVFLFSAVSISLGNWMDRNTRIHLDEAGVSFENGLRKTRLTWPEIIEVRTAPARWGLSVQVLGSREHFSFSTLGEMRFQGQVRGKTGFAAGAEILDEIISKAGLKKTDAGGQFVIYTRLG